MRRALFVSRSRYVLPLAPGLARKWDTLSARLDVRVLAAAGPRRTGSDPRFVLVPRFPVRALDPALFWLGLPFRVARELRRHPRDVVVAQSPFEGLAALAGRRLARSRAAVIVELHGDWRTFARLYGSAPRKALAPLLDRAAVAVLRRADAVRAVSPTLARDAAAAGARVADTFTTFTDASAFESERVPLPGRPALLFVGVLQPYKNVDGIVAAWPRVASQVPDATLTMVGRGPMLDLVDALVRAHPSVTHLEALPQPELAEALDRSWGLLLPSRSEGLPRIAIESFCRGRPVIGGRGGGIPDIVVDGENGLLVDPEDVDGLAAAMVRLLSDRAGCERLAAGASRDAERWRQTPEEFAQRMAELVETVLAP